MSNLFISLLILALGFPNHMAEAATLNALFCAYVLFARRTEIKPKTKNGRTWKSTYVH